MTAPTLTPEDAVYDLRAFICAHHGNISEQAKREALAAHEALDVLVIALASAGLMQGQLALPPAPEDRR